MAATLQNLVVEKLVSDRRAAETHVEVSEKKP